MPSTVSDPWFFYRARAYRADAGRFVQRDPRVFADGSNGYLYVRNDPVSSTDPFGMKQRKHKPTTGSTEPGAEDPEPPIDNGGDSPVDITVSANCGNDKDQAAIKKMAEAAAKKLAAEGDQLPCVTIDCQDLSTAGPNNKPSCGTFVAPHYGDNHSDCGLVTINTGPAGWQLNGTGTFASSGTTCADVFGIACTITHEMAHSQYFFNHPWGWESPDYEPWDENYAQWAAWTYSPSGTCPAPSAWSIH